MVADSSGQQDSAFAAAFRQTTMFCEATGLLPPDESCDDDESASATRRRLRGGAMAVMFSLSNHKHRARLAQGQEMAFSMARESVVQELEQVQHELAEVRAHAVAGAGAREEEEGREGGGQP
eukprot:SAG11_NODE_1818_length_4215_cov_1.631438_3_plen_122_part_00